MESDSNKVKRITPVFDAAVKLAKSGSCPCHCDCSDCLALWKAVDKAIKEAPDGM